MSTQDNKELAPFNKKEVAAFIDAWNKTQSFAVAYAHAMRAK